MLQHVDQDAQEIQLRGHPLFFGTRIKTRREARVDAGLCDPDPGRAGFDLFQYLGSAPNGVVRHVAPSPHPTQHNLERLIEKS